MIAAILMIAVAALVSGCGTGGGNTLETPELNTPFEEFFRAPSNDAPAVGHAVIVGLTKVIPRYYDGWDGDCPGCDVDASNMAWYCKENGYQYTVLRDRNATKARCEAAARAAATGLRPDKDLLYIYASGHGGQVADDDGDESDGQDETLCLADGQMTDDYIRKLLSEVPANVRVVFITDTCNSGSNYRARSFRQVLTATEITCRVLHIGGCSDGYASEGSPDGGNLTLALMKALSQDPTWKTWVELARPHMWGRQWAIYNEWNVNESFRNLKVKR